MTGINQGKMALEGVRVVEMGTLIAGPFCGRLLGDFGAEIVKVEPPGTGDPMREWGVGVHETRSLWWTVQSRNKKCVTLDLRKPAGQALARRLVAQSDVLVENFRPGTMEKWNLGYETLRAVNPGLVMVRISGFGQYGPYRDKAGFGSVAEGMGGLRYITGYPDRPPTRIGISIGDALAAMFGAIGALNALYFRDVAGGGVGQCIDVALYEAVFALMESALPDYDKTGFVRERTGTILPRIAPSNTYPTRDGKWVIIGGNADSVFRRLAACMGQPELADDPRFSTHQARGEHQELLDDLIAEWTRRHDLGDLVALLDRAGVPAGPIYSIADIVDDPHYRARNMILEVPDPNWGTVKMPGLVPKLSHTPGQVKWSGPALGEHNREIYCGLLGLGDAEFERLRAEGVI